MSLVVGIVFPWSDLVREHAAARALLEQVGSPMGVIVAADSRWSYPDDSTEDGAVKVFGIGTNAVAGYAGSARIGEEAIGALSQGLGNTATWDELSNEVRASLLNVWSRSADDEDDLQIVIGASTSDGNAWMRSFEAANEFRPTEATDICVLGPEEGRTFFLQSLRAAVRQAESIAQERLVPLSLREWASLVGVIVAEVGELRIHPEIGGGVLCSATYGGRAHGIGITRVTSVNGEIKIDEPSLTEGTGKTLRKYWRYGTVSDPHQS